MPVGVVVVVVFRLATSIGYWFTSTAYLPPGFSRLDIVPGIEMTPAHLPVGNAVFLLQYPTVLPGSSPRWQFELCINLLWSSTACLNPGLSTSGSMVVKSKNMLWQSCDDSVDDWRLQPSACKMGAKNAFDLHAVHAMCAAIQ